MSSEVRQLLADAQAAEVKGDKREAVALLRKAAEYYRDRKLGTKALKMLRQIRRLEGVEEPPESIDGELPEPVMPFETQEFQGPSPARTMPERGPVLADPSFDAWCSFCCRPRVEVGPLVQAPTGTFICRQCVGAARALLEKAP